jgi:hypothetical protein
MSERKIIQIGYRPRNQFKIFHKRKQRWSVLVCHRRAGKTVATLNDLIRGAVNEGKHEGRYAFIFPQRNQAKDTAWRYLRRYAEPLLAKPPNESELRVDLINGSMIRLYGADNPDALRSGRPMRGFLFVGPEGVRTDAQLRKWLNWCTSYAASDQVKKKSKRRTSSQGRAANKKTAKRKSSRS